MFSLSDTLPRKHNLSQMTGRKVSYFFLSPNSLFIYLPEAKILLPHCGDTRPMIIICIIAFAALIKYSDTNFEAQNFLYK